ncbi:hypothetical protein MBLNU13_g00597t2 [Cladosporium sp. NU13]
MLCHLALSLLLSTVGLANQTGSQQPHACGESVKTVELDNHVTYRGTHKDGVEAFLGIKYAHDTSGANRFKAPKPFTPSPGSFISADRPGPACPQDVSVGEDFLPLYLTIFRDTSEDCLSLNVNRPNGTRKGDMLPVMVFIHGGSYIVGAKDELTSQPGGLIIESVNNGLPVIHVSLNYRLGILGFAKSAALSTQNAALRDQRMALEWVQENIAAFGGDPDNITIHGQSSGGLSVGLQIMAYGGSKPVPFHKAIAQSQVLEPGLTGEFTDNAMARVLNASTCNTTSADSQAAIDCLRTLSAKDLIKLQTDTVVGSENIGDIWLPTVDGDILPSAPSQLLSEGRFAAITTIMGYTEDDTAPFTDIIIKTANQTEKFFRDYAPAMSDANLQHLLSLYPVEEFAANPSANLSAEFYRSARILRDILMVCEPLLYGQALAQRGQKVYYYDQNQTVVDGPLESLGLPGLGVVHTSEFAYMFNNISHYDINDYSYNPTASDKRLAIRETRSFSTFASLGQPSLKGHGTLEGWEPAFGSGNETGVFVIGSDEEGLHSLHDESSVIGRQRLEERCAFINSPEVVAQLQF